MKLFELLRRPKVSGDEIEKALEQAMREHEAALEELAAAEQAYGASLLHEDPKVSVAASTRQATARVAVDRAIALVEALGPRLAEARERAAEAERRRVCDKTKR